MRMALAVVLAGTLVSPARSQIDFAKLDAAIRYAIDDEGRVLIAPDPLAGWTHDTFTPLVPERLDHVIANAGAMGLASYLFCGNTDVASLTDSTAFFARLGRDSDAEILQCIAGDEEQQQHSLLQRLLAIRVAQERPLKPAIGVLERLAKQEESDIHFRRAIDETLATLRGQTHDAPPQLPRLEDVLAEAPRADVHLCIDEFRLPAARPLLRTAAAAGLEITRRVILNAGGSVSEKIWAGAHLIAEGAALIPYEVARRFGNARVHRVVIAAQLPRQERDAPRIWAHLDGIFDVGAMRTGLTRANLEVRGSEDRIECAIFDGIELVATPASVRIRSAGVTGVLGREAAETLARTIESDDAPIVAVIAKDAILPDPIVRLGRPERLAIWLPRQGDEPVRAQLQCADDRLPTLITGEVQGFKRRLEEWVDEDAQLEILERVYATVRVETAADTCTLSCSLKDVAVGDVIMAIVRSGKLH